MPRQRYGGRAAMSFDDGGLVQDSGDGSPIAAADLGNSDWQPWSGASLLALGDNPWADRSGMAEHLARITDAFAPPAAGVPTTDLNAGASDTQAFAADPGLTANGYFGSYVPSWMSEPGTVGEHLAAIFDAFRPPLPDENSALLPVASQPPALAPWLEGAVHARSPVSRRSRTRSHCSPHAGN